MTFGISDFRDRRHGEPETLETNNIDGNRERRVGEETGGSLLDEDGDSNEGDKAEGAGIGKDKGGVSERRYRKLKGLKEEAY